MFRRWFEAVMGSAETRRLVRGNLHPKAAFWRAGHLYTQNPVAIFAFMYPVIFLLTGMVRPEYLHPDLLPYHSHLLTTGKVLIYWGISWAVMGQFIWWTMRLGLPFIVAPVFMWGLAVTLSNLGSLLVVGGAAWDLSRLWRQGVLGVPGSIAITYAIAHRLRAMLGEVPEMVPIWLPMQSIAVPLIYRLSADRRGRLLRIHAANQYVEVVTDAGTTLLRIGLRQAVALVPADKGWLCHRSLWISRDEVVGLSYVGGQPQITDRAGKTFAISRKMAPDIRDWLMRTQPRSDVAEGDLLADPAAPSR